MRVSACDVYGEPLSCSHIITIRRMGKGSPHRQTADLPAGGVAVFDVKVTDHYRLRVIASGYTAAAVTRPGTDQEVEVVVPVSSNAVVGYRWPDPVPEIPGIGALVWSQLEDVHRGTLLNIWAKLWDVPVSISPAQAFVEEVLEVRVDRIIVRVADELPELLAGQDHLDAVPSMMHDPPPGYHNGISVKSKGRGNIQITTFLPLALVSDLPTLADIDIDENRRTFAHLFDVLKHKVTGDETDPVEIQAILLVHAGVDPGWRPLVA